MPTRLYDVYVATFHFGARGPVSTIMLRRIEDDALAIGTIRYDDVTEGIAYGAQGLDWIEDNAERVWASLLVPLDDGIFPGWSTSPHVEIKMIERAKEKAGW